VDSEIKGRLAGKVFELAVRVFGFLASDESASMTGIDRVVDGGMKVW
jgi:hypothetical protein